MESTIIDNTIFGHGIMIRRTLEKNIHVRTWLCIVWQSCEKHDKIMESTWFLFLFMLGST